MGNECIKCGESISELVNMETVNDLYIECPQCKYKMIVKYDVDWNGEYEEFCFWVEDYTI